MKTRTTLLKVLVIIILGGTVWLLLRPKPVPPITVPEGAGAGDIFLNPFTHKTKTATYQADRGTLVVPENRSRPGSRLIALPVKRIHAASVSPAEPIFYLAGGPGQSNMGFKPSDALLANHDIVLVGYRGVNGSVKLDCPEVARAIVGGSGDLGSSESLDRIAEAVRTSGRRLQSEGVDLAGYTIPEVVEDMEAARLGLKYDRINLLSESYGTRVAQIYAYLYPQSLRRSAMIGVNPPGHFVWEPEMIDSQIEAYSNLWAQDEACRSRTPDLSASMRKAAHGMPRRWLFWRIDPTKTKALSFFLLFHRTTAPLIFNAYLAAERGDAAGLALMSVIYDLMMPKIFTWGDLFAKGFIDYDPNRDYRRDMSAPDSILGSPAGLLIWGGAAKAWPASAPADEFRKVHPSDVETLLINGRLDFSTPVQYARDELLPSLKNGRLIVLSEMGHVGDFWGTQPKAARRLLTSFYDTGVADDSLFTYVPMKFDVSIGFPLIAKAVLGLGGLLALAIVWIGIVVYRQRRKARKGKAKSGYVT